MELTLQVDGTQLSDEVRELLDNLTPEQKQDMALQLLRDSMHDTETRFNKRVGIEQALEEMSSGKVKYQYVRETPHYGDARMVLQRCRIDADARDWEKSWRSAERIEQDRFDRLTKYYAHPVTYFREDILKEMMRIGREKVENAVAESDTVQKALDEAVKGVVENLPGMVMHVMESLFARQMVEALSVHSITTEFTERHDNAVKELAERLDRANLY